MRRALTSLQQFQYPHPVVLGKVNATARKFTDEHLDRVCELCYRASKASQGVGDGVLETPEQVRVFTDPGHTVMFEDDNVSEAGKDPLFAALMMYPSPLARSTRPTYASSFFFVDPQYRSSGSGKSIMLYFAEYVAAEGWLGIVGRMALSAKTPLPALTMGTCFPGVIPRSLDVPPWGWVDDLIACQDVLYFHEMANAETPASDVRRAILAAALEGRSTIPDLKPVVDFRKPETPVQPKELRDNKGNAFTLRQPATGKEMEHIHELYQTAARNGEGYACDEFTDDGLLTHRLLREVQTLGVFRPEGGKPVGAAILGLAAIPRTPDRSVAGYLVVAPQHSGAGIGNKLLQHTEEYAQALKKDGVLFDVFANNGKAIQWLVRKGYVITGTIPNTGVFRDRGFTDAFLMYKNLNPSVHYPTRVSQL